MSYSLLLPWLLSACTPASVPVEVPCHGCSPGEVLAPEELEVWLSEEVPTVAWARWEARTEGQGVVIWRDGEGEEVRSPALAAEDGVFQVPLLGLAAGHAYGLRAVELVEAEEAWSSAEGWVSVAPPPQQLVLPGLSEAAFDRLSPAFVLTTQVNEDTAWALILDLQGRVVWYQANALGLGLSVDATGAIRWEEQDRQQDDSLTQVRAVAVDGSWSSTTLTPEGHHDLAVLPDGTIARPMRIRLPHEDGVMLSDGILEVEEGSADTASPEPVFDLAAAWEGPVEPQESAEGLVWSHANSLAYVDGRYYLMARNLDALVAVDRESAELLWVLGGPSSDFTVASGEMEWSHPHLSQVWDQGVAVFDNGVGHEPPTSRAMVYAWDEQALTFTATWEHAHPNQISCPVAGDVRVLPSGDVLVAWGTSGLLQVLTPEHEVVWEIWLPLGAAFGRVIWLEDLYDLR